MAGLFKTNYRAITWLNFIQALTPPPKKKPYLSSVQRPWTTFSGLMSG